MNKKLLDLIRNKYDINEISSFELIESGQTNLSYKITTKSNCYYLKQYIYNESERIETIIKIKKYLAQHNIPTIPLIATDDNKDYFSLDNHYFALYPFIEGKVFTAEDTMQKDILIESAKMLAKIHLLSKDKLPDLTDRIAWGWNKDAYIKAMNEVVKAIDKNKDDFSKTALGLLNRKKEIAEKNTLNYIDLDLKNDHLCHGDYQSQNLIFDDNNKIIAVLDLEIARNAPRVLELMRAIDLFFFSGKFEETNFDNARIFFVEYNKVYPIDLDELKRGMKAYFYLEYVYTTWLEARHYLQNNNRSDNFANVKIASLDYFSDNLDGFIEKFYA